MWLLRRQPGAAERDRVLVLGLPIEGRDHAACVDDGVALATGQVRDTVGGECVVVVTAAYTRHPVECECVVVQTISTGLRWCEHADRERPIAWRREGGGPGVRVGVADVDVTSLPSEYEMPGAAEAARRRTIRLSRLRRGPNLRLLC